MGGLCLGEMRGGCREKRGCRRGNGNGNSMYYLGVLRFVFAVGEVVVC